MFPQVVKKNYTYKKEIFAKIKISFTYVCEQNRLIKNAIKHNLFERYYNIENFLMKTVEQTFASAFEETLKVIPEFTYEFEQVNNAGDVKKYKIQPFEFESSLKKKYGDFNTFSKNFTKHLLGQKNIVAAFASTPTSFSDAWNMKSEELIAEDVLALSKSGGHFQFNQIPYGPDNSGSPLYQNNYPKGLVHSKATGLIKGFRHKTGGVYEADSLNEMGVFTYATPNNPAGMMDYRFAEKFSKKLGVPLIFVITQWFKYKTNFEELNSWIYMTGVAKVYSESNHPHDPIKLQLINKDEGIKLINNLLDAMQTKGEYRVRPPLPEHLRLGWSYNKIKQDKEKRKNIIEYSIKNSHRCPGDKCNNVFFKDLKSVNIHIGHRISQNWNALNTGVADVHHPYNLYLSCGVCNTSLSQKYPTEIDQLISHMGTIGDWLITDLLD